MEVSLKGIQNLEKRQLKFMELHVKFVVLILKKSTETLVKILLKFIILNQCTILEKKF